MGTGMFKECRFIKANGLKCQSPALRGSPFCYFHVRTRVVVPRRPRRPKDEPVNLPVLSDRSGVLTIINEVLQGVASNTMSPRRAGSLLYALQMASQNLGGIPLALGPANAAPCNRGLPGSSGS